LRQNIKKESKSTIEILVAEAALAPDEEATQVEEGAAVADHEDGDPLVDEAAEEEAHDDAPMIPKECALCREPMCTAHVF